MSIDRAVVEFEHLKSSALISRRDLGAGIEDLLQRFWPEDLQRPLASDS
jgi:hypothetical protein